MAKDDFTPEEWATLTEEERKAHEEDDEEEGAALNEEEEGQHEDGESEGSEESEGEGEESGEEQAGEQPQEKEQKPAPSVPPHFAPVLPINAEVAEIDGKLAAIDEAFNEGDLDQIEWQKQREPLLQQKFEIQMSEKINQETAKQLWRYEQGLFFKDNPEYRENEFLNAALQRAFHKIDTPENAGKTGLELLNDAKAMVMEQISAITGQKQQGPDGKQGQEKQPSQKRSLDSVELPKTLAGLPASDQNDTNKDEFAYLDKLDGVELEMAVAKLTPDQERRYLGR